MRREKLNGFVSESNTLRKPSLSSSEGKMITEVK